MYPDHIKIQVYIIERSIYINNTNIYYSSMYSLEIGFCGSPMMKCPSFSNSIYSIFCIYGIIDAVIIMITNTYI